MSSELTNYILASLIIVAVHVLVSLVMLIVSFRALQRGQGIVWLVSLVVCVTLLVLLILAYNQSVSNDNSSSGRRPFAPSRSPAPSRRR